MICAQFPRLLRLLSVLLAAQLTFTVQLPPTQALVLVSVSVPSACTDRAPELPVI
jgi:hypothetical protein